MLFRSAILFQPAAKKVTFQLRIKSIKITPLRLPLKTPYIWSQGVEDAFCVNLITIEAEDGTIGFGETTVAPDAGAQKTVLTKMAVFLIGQPVQDFARLSPDIYKSLFLVFGANMPRYFNQMICGLEMAILDLQGKLLGLPVWDLLGGAVRKDVGYFYFLQGETIEALVEDAKKAIAEALTLRGNAKKLQAQTTVLPGPNPQKNLRGDAFRLLTLTQKEPKEIWPR